jgi:gamma-glutamyltranspeptidase/glutathione hydrolase
VYQHEHKIWMEEVPLIQKISIVCVIVFLMCFCAGESKTGVEVVQGTDSSPSVAGKGMVSSAHPLATEAGVVILQAGGSAFDAAVTIASVLNVVEPMMSGIGGYGTILVYDAKNKKIRFLDSSGKIPMAVDSDVFRAPTSNYRENRRGPKAVSTPGNVNAWQAMSTEYGKLEWRQLFKLASEGFIISEGLAGMISYVFKSFPEHAKRFYGKDGEPLKAGEPLIQKDLAGSLKLIADQGAKAVYGGEIGKAIDAAMEKSGGFLSIDDLIADKAEWWEPIHIRYRDYEVYTASPPSTAFPSLIRLGLMSRFNGAELGHNTIAYLHCFAEVTKHAFWCRLAYAGDPEINPPPLDKLLSESYWKEAVSQIDLEKAKPFVPPDITIPKDSHTTHFVVADQWGNIVSATQTLGGAFGSRIMPEGTGIWLNNSLSFCTFEPKGNPMDAHAGHRKLSGDCPTIIVRDGKPLVALGTPGGHTIGQTVPQMVMNIIDFGMNIQEAIAASRVSFAEPNFYLVEQRIPEEVHKGLEAMGHNVREVRGLGNAHGLKIVYDEDGKPIRFEGGADPRGQGKAAGY